MHIAHVPVISKSVFRYRKVSFYPTNIDNVSFYGKFIDIDIDAQYQEIYTDILIFPVFYSTIFEVTWIIYKQGFHEISYSQSFFCPFKRLFSGGKLVIETKSNRLGDENFEKLLQLNFNRNLVLILLKCVWQKNEYRYWYWKILQYSSEILILT